ncbi:hypothetical protein [Actinopolyspora alba]|nr:hypothetical protein [Actinopolyspora alba]
MAQERSPVRRVVADLLGEVVPQSCEQFAQPIDILGIQTGPQALIERDRR